MSTKNSFTHRPGSVQLIRGILFARDENTNACSVSAPALLRPNMQQTPANIDLLRPELIFRPWLAGDCLIRILGFGFLSSLGIRHSSFALHTLHTCNSQMEHA